MKRYFVFKILFNALVLSCLVLHGCQKKPLTEAELQAYVQDPKNGLIQTEEKGNTRIEARIRPNELLIAQELRTLSHPSTASRDSLEKLYAHRLYVMLSMQKNGQEIESQFLYDRALYQQAVQYLTGSMEHDVKLVTKEDTLNPIGFLYPRMYGETGQSTVMVVFEQTLASQAPEVVLLWNDRQFGTGNHRFAFHLNRDLTD